MQTINLEVVENSHAVPMESEQALVVEAVSPTVSVERVDGGVQLIVHDLHGAHAAEIFDGQQGEQGLPGNDGYTPVKGVDYFDGQDGKDGQDGAPGRDGYTPVKGVDYWTQADAAAVTQAAVEAVLDAYPAAEGVSF